MLVLGRKLGQTVKIGDEITITVVRIGRSEVRIGVDAPRTVKVLRQEIAVADQGRILARALG